MITLFSQFLTLVFPLNKKERLFSLHSFYARADWDGFQNHIRDNPQNIIFNLRASAAASKFCEWVQAGTDVYVQHQKYQSKYYPSSWFSAAFGAVTVHRNQFFCVYQQNIFRLRPSSTRLAIVAERFLNLLNFVYAAKTRESVNLQKLASRDSRRTGKTVLNKCKSILPLMISVVYCI